MVKSWEMKVKHDFFLGLIKNLAENRSSIATLKLFKNLIKDQKEKFTYTTYNASPQKGEDSKVEEAPLTLSTSLQKLITENGLVKVLLVNLQYYCDEVNKRIGSNEFDLTQAKKLFVLNPKYSHTDEIDERLQFLKYLAQVSTDYQVSKSELDILYSLLVTKSLIPSD